MRKLAIISMLFFLLGCQSESQSSKKNLSISLITPNGEKIDTIVTIDPKDQAKGLSGVKPEDFRNDQGMLFFYLEDEERHFWMPDTYFDLDLFYLDKELRVIDIIRKLPFYTGRVNPELIPRARGVWSRHVLEMKSSSTIAQNIKIGMQFKWEGKTSLNETENVAKIILNQSR